MKIEVTTIKEAIADAHFDMLMEDLLDPEHKYSIKTSRKKHAQTAFWSFRKGRHHIYIGEKVCDNVGDDKEPDSHYIQSYLYHEVAHSLWTEKNLRAVNAALRSEGIPFSLFNLFEDARIEHKMRDTSGRDFRWSDYEVYESKEDPLYKFFLLIQHDFSGMPRAKQLRMLKSFEIDEQIVKYYHEVIACSDTWKVIEVIERWLKEYPPSSQEQLLAALEALGFDSESDLSASLALEMSESDAAEMDEDAEEIVGNDGDSKTGGSCSKEERDYSEEVAEHTSRDFRRESSYTEIDQNKVKALLPKVKTIFAAKKGMESSRRPAKRLNMKGILRESDLCYRRKTIYERDRRKFNIVIDCSGSMWNHMNGSATITAIFNALARDGLMDGYIVLSSSYGYQTFKMPVADETIEKSFVANGDEGFAFTFSKTEAILKEADINFVLTDGDIVDAPLNKAELTQKGIKTFGLYVGDPETCDLSRWFNKSIARERLSELVDVLVRTILVEPL